MFRSSVCFVGVVLLAAVEASAFEVGEKVVVVRRTELTSLSGGKSVPMLGTTLTVQAVEGDRLKVGGGRVGGLDAAGVVASKDADSHFSDLIAKNRGDASALLGRGRLRFDRGDHKAAIADLDACVKLAPNSDALAIRGFAWKRSGDKEKALADFDAAIKLDPRNALAWRIRGATWASKEDYAKAVAEYSESIRLDPENPESLHHRAVMLAACYDDAVRNGKQAVADATKACELTEWKQPLFLNGLVMALAESGDFDAAIREQKKVIALGGGGTDRLDQLQKRRPFRNRWR